MYFREVRDHHREVARYYIQLAEKEEPVFRQDGDDWLKAAARRSTGAGAHALLTSRQM